MPELPANGNHACICVTICVILPAHLLPQVSELETKVAEMVAKGPKGVVAREEMMRALGAITTDLSGRIKV
jgi:hypothetical protein